MKYYIIPIDGYDQFNAAEKLASNQGVDVSEVVFLGPNDPSQVFRVPNMQGYEGKALVVCSNQVMESPLNVDSVNVNAITYNSSKDIFVVNCSCVIFHQVFRAKSIATMNLSPYLAFNIGPGYGYWNVDDSLVMHFSNSKPSPHVVSSSPPPIPEFNDKWEVPKVDEPLTDDTEEGWHDDPTDLVDNEE